MSTSAGGPRISDLLRSTSEALRRAGVENPRFEAQTLLADLLDVDRGRLLARGPERLPPSVLGAYESRVQRRVAREPFQHIVGTVEFFGLQLEVDSRALIPRPETELLVDVALAVELQREARIVDLGTGSGCIAVALAVHRPAWRMTAVDRSVACLELARNNAGRHGVERRVELVAGDFAALPEDWKGGFDLVVSNPPYVALAEWRELEPEVRDHEPRDALVPGPTGLEAFESIAGAARRLLRADGTLVLEVGYGQAERVTRMLELHGFCEIVTTEDFQRIPRVIRATCGGGGRR